MNSVYIDILGIVISLFGVIVLSIGLMSKRKEALRVGGSRMAEEKDELNACLPHVKEEMREGRLALYGVILFAVGSVFQIAGNLMG